MAGERAENLTVVSVSGVAGARNQAIGNAELTDPSIVVDNNALAPSGNILRVDNGVMPVNMNAPARIINVNAGRRRGSVWGLIIGSAAVGLTGAGVLLHQQSKAWVTNNNTARNFRDRACRTVLDVTAGRAESFFKEASVYLGCFETPDTPEGITATGVPLPTTVQASLAPGYTSSNYQNGTMVVSTPVEIPKPGDVAQITTADGLLHTGDMFDNTTYVGTDAAPYVESSKPTLEGFTQFWNNVDTSNKGIFAEGLAVNGRTDTHITPVRLVEHWTGSPDGTILHTAQAMAGRRGTPECGQSGCDVQMIMGHDGAEDGQLAIVSPSLDTQMQHIAHYNKDSLGVEIIGTPQGSNNTSPNFTSKQMENLTYLEVGLHEIFPTILLQEAEESNGYVGIVGHGSMPNQNKTKVEPGSGIVELSLRNAALFYKQHQEEVAKVIDRQASGDFSEAQIAQFEKDVQAFEDSTPHITPEDAIRRLVANKGGTPDEKFGPTKVPQDIAFKAEILAGWDIEVIPDAYDVFFGESAWYEQSVSESDLGLIDVSKHKRVPPISDDGHVNVVGSFGVCQANYGQENTSRKDREPTQHLNDLVYTLTWCRQLYEGNGDFGAWGAFNDGSYKNGSKDTKAAFEEFLAANPTQPGEPITVDTGPTTVDTIVPDGTLPKRVFIGDSLTEGMNHDRYLEEQLGLVSSSVLVDGQSNRRLVSAVCAKDEGSKQCQDLPDVIRTIDKHASEVEEAKKVTVAAGTNDPLNDKTDEYSPDMEEVLIHVVDVGGADGVIPETDIVEVYGDKPSLNIDKRSDQLPGIIERVEAARPKAKGKFRIIKMASFVTQALDDDKIILPDGVHAGDGASWHILTDELVRQS